MQQKKSAVPGRNLCPPSEIQHISCLEWSSPSNNNSIKALVARPQNVAQVTGSNCKSVSHPSRWLCRCHWDLDDCSHLAVQLAGHWHSAVLVYPAVTQIKVWLIYASNAIVHQVQTQECMHVSRAPVVQTGSPMLALMSMMSLLNVL